MQISSKTRSKVVTTPFGLSRVILLGVFVVYTVLSGPHFLQWPPWEKVLLASGAYSHDCGGVASPAVVVAGGCAAQKARVSGLINLCTASMFAVSFLAGLVTDIVGPKATCLFGNGLYLLGWIVLVALPGTGAKYPIGFAIMAGGGDPAFFGTLTIANLFPGRSSTIIAILGAARSLTSLIPLVWEKLGEKHPSFNFQASAICMIVINLVCIAMVLVFVPRSPYPIPEQEQEEAIPNNLMMEDNRTRETDNRVEIASIVKKQQQTTGRQDGGAGHGYEGDEGTDPATTTTMAKEPLLTVARRELIIAWKYLASWLYLPVVLISLCNIVRANLLLSSASAQLTHPTTEGPLDALKILLILSFIPGPVFGWLADRYGPLAVMTGINSSNTLVFVALLVSQLLKGRRSALFFKYCVPVLSLPGLAFLLSQVYCYVAVVFPAKDLGKLVGLASCIGGLVGLLNLLLPAGNYVLPDAIGIVLSALCFAAIGFLIWQRKRELQPNGQPAV